MIACKRCGICCKSGPCGWGEKDKYGICKYLREKNNVHFCLIFLRGLASKEDLFIGGGCVLRTIPKPFSYYEENCAKGIVKKLKKYNGK